MFATSNTDSITEKLTYVKGIITNSVKPETSQAMKLLLGAIDIQIEITEDEMKFKESAKDVEELKILKWIRNNVHLGAYPTKRARVRRETR